MVLIVLCRIKSQLSCECLIALKVSATNAIYEEMSNRMAEHSCFFFKSPLLSSPYNCRLWRLGHRSSDFKLNVCALL